MPPKQQICKECLELDLTAFFESEYVNCQGMKEYHIPIKRPRKSPESTDCALCSILSRSTLNDLPGENALSSDQESYELRAVEYKWLSRIGRYHTDGSDALVLIICSRMLARAMREPLFSKREIRDRITENGYAILERPSGQTEYLTKSPSERFDALQTLDWICECERHSKTTCRPMRRPILDLYLVDCRELTVVPARDTYQYVALSYVWGMSSGDTMAYQLRRSEDNKTIYLPESLPLVVTDAITVTKSLCFQYLWVDKFCIAQEHAEVKHRQIEEMDAVYANSELTIIAAAGRDQSYGLPGVSCRSRAATPVAEIRGSRVLWLPNPQVSIRNSKWNTRGWTYQEAILARRRLVFLDDQTYFECGTGEHCEMIQRPSSWKRVFQRREFNIGGLWNKLAQTPAFELFIYIDDMLGEYTARELGYDDDSLLALLGILRQLREAPFGLRHIWGIPWDIKTPRILAPSAHLIFVTGLCWNHVRSCWETSGKPRRRPMLPSWTWAGWAGQVESRTRSVINLGLGKITVRLRQILLEDLHGHKSTVSVAAKSTLREAFRHPILFIETAAVSPDKIHFRAMPDGSINWTIHGCKTSRIYLSEGAASEVELVKQLKENGESWRCVLLGDYNRSSIRPGGGVILLILRKEVDEDMWARVGIMLLECDSSDTTELTRELLSSTIEFKIK
ncbi:HET-domain-containing protein [Hypoxylon sp. NC1633]|nr:HET-domain-containing protein [Hypoxylon sp. NC1633]